MVLVVGEHYFVIGSEREPFSLHCAQEWLTTLLYIYEDVGCRALVDGRVCHDGCRVRMRLAEEKRSLIVITSKHHHTPSPPSLM